MPRPVIELSEANFDIRPHPTRPGHVRFTIDAYELDMSLAEFEAFIAKLARMRRLLED